ncbi:MAG TPA: SWIM zinc finger family protein [Streptosporangiaceae bacterium]
MSGWDGDFYPASRPLKADGGIKARSKRGPIGEQWWSRRFIDVLESFGMQGRLSRGRNYARSGQVLNLDVSTGHVTAQVQGSRIKPYKVKLTVDPLTTAQWQRVEAALAARAVFRARLLAGEMPAEIEEVFTRCGTPLFPRTARDLEMSCSCPDWEVPCKHLAAVCYVLAEKFDDDPFTMLAWRGKGRDELLRALRLLSGASAPGRRARPGGRRSVADQHVAEQDVDGPGRGDRPIGDGPSGDGPSGDRHGASRSGSAAEPMEPPLDECIDGFWSTTLSPARLRALPATTAAPPDLLLRSLEPPLILIGGQDLPTLLRPAYELMGGTGPAASE